MLLMVPRAGKMLSVRPCDHAIGMCEYTADWFTRLWQDDCDCDQIVAEIMRRLSLSGK